MGELLSIKLIEILREEKSGVYGVGANGSSSKDPYESYSLSIRFPCAPENVDDLIAATMAEINDIKNKIYCFRYLDIAFERSKSC